MKKPLHTRSVQLITGNVPFAFIEAYKSVRTNLQFASISKSYKTIVVTSSMPGEGKSTVSVNLALSLADTGSKVLLVDTDLRKPVIQRYLRLNSAKGIGLTNILTDFKRLQQEVIYLSDAGLSVMLSGPIPPNPAEILGSEKMKELVTQLRQEYDYVIFDTPPVTVVTDAAVLSASCDGVILVVRQGFTPYETAVLAKSNLSNVGANIIGCILNDFKASQSNRAYTYYRYKESGYEYTRK